MENIEDILSIIDSVKSGSVAGISTNVTPTIRDMLSARIIFNHFSEKNFKERFGNTCLWLENLQKKENWKAMLQDFLFLTRECV
jgi:hypothetical protein